MSSGLMSEKQEKVMVSMWCRGPGVPWKSLTGEERLSIVFRKSAEENRFAIFENLSLKFGECGLQLVELDMHDLDDIYPNECSICKTDMCWDMDGFYKMYPQYHYSNLDNE
jgi:hypothetical protein